MRDIAAIENRWGKMIPIAEIPCDTSIVAKNRQRMAMRAFFGALSSQNSLERTLAPSSLTLSSVRSEVLGAWKRATQKLLHSKPPNLLDVCGLTCRLLWFSSTTRQAHEKLQSVSHACPRTCLEGFGTPKCTPELNTKVALNQISCSTLYANNGICMRARQKTEMRHSCLKHLKSEIHACKTR